MKITIIGAGTLGLRLVKLLLEENHNITVIDKNEARVDKIVDKYDVQGVVGLGTHYEVLKEADIKTCDLVIATTPSDENNILSCLISSKMGAKNTIARVRNPEYATQIDFMRDELGVSMMINPDFSAALAIYKMLQFPYAVCVESFSNGRVDIAGIKIKTESPLANTKVSEIAKLDIDKCLICAVSRENDVFIPSGDFVIEVGDIVHITGSHKDLPKIARVISGRKVKTAKEIMLIGGTRLAFYLSNLLTASGKSVIVIEPDKENCDKLYELCPKATVINGDFSDYSLLDEEGIEDMDAVVTLTESDETNFLVSMFSDSVGVKQNITKVKSRNLLNMLNKMGMNSYVSVTETTCDTIAQYVRAKKSVSSSGMKNLYKLVDGKIEAIEFIVDNNTKLIGKPLNSIKLKNDVLIAAIIRENKIIIPSGSDSVEPGDRVVIVSKESIIYTLNDILAWEHKII